MSNADIGGVPHFDCKDNANLASRWKKWKKSFDYYLTARGVTQDARKVALLMHCAGPEVQELYETLDDPGVDADGDGGAGEFAKTVRTLEAYFITKVNTPYERHVFRSLQQENNETVGQFASRLKIQAANCAFARAEEDIRDQIIEKCVSDKLRRKLLEKREIKLTEVLEIARATEAVDQHAKAFVRSFVEPAKGVVEPVESVRHVAGNPRDKRAQSRQQTTCCYRCGRNDHLQHSTECPARGAKCRKCQMIGHFAVCCKTKQQAKTSWTKANGDKRWHGVRNRKTTTQQPRSGAVNAVDCGEDSSDDFVFGVDGNKKLKCVNLNIGGVLLQMIVDTGSTVNIIDGDTWDNLKCKRVKCITQRKGCDRELFTYAAHKPLEILGCFTACVRFQDCEVAAEFVVVKGSGKPLLGYETAVELGVLKMCCNVGEMKDEVMKEFGSVFEGIGKLKGVQVRLHRKSENDVKPVIQQLRRPPFSMRSRIEKELDTLEDLDIIEKVNEPSRWVSPIVVVPKANGEIRICVDMRQANKAIEREIFPIPTVEETLQDFNGCSMFSKLDLTRGYHQIEIEEGSREITTFITHNGMYRYKRLMFGISSAPEKYQQVMQQVLHGIDGVRNISDDITVAGETKAQHDSRLRQVLARLSQAGLTLNAEKCRFGIDRMEFFGLVLSERGVDISKDKVHAVENAREPETAAEVRSFLGLVNFSARFIPNLATVSEPLRRLTRKDVPFEWGLDQANAFKMLKSALSDAQTLGYYARDAETHVIADASPVGLGAVIVQRQNDEYRVIAYASRSLTDVERRYSQTEKEALGLVWACERFHMYLYGTKFQLITDHKPLEVLYSTRSKPSARIERWVLRLQSYDYVVKYRPGKENIADALSRLSCGTRSTNTEKRNVTEEYVRAIAAEAVPKAMLPREVEQASNDDVEMSMLRHCINTDSWSQPEAMKYVHVKNELCVLGKLVMRGTRLVIPKALRQRVLEIAHEGHVGIAAMKLRLRTKVWWPSIDKDAEKHVKLCHGCQLMAKPTAPEPMIRTELPPGKWQDVAVDLLGPMPTGEYLLVVVDYYTRYYEVEITMSTTTRRVCTLLDKIFSVHGFPVTLKSDNGPQFIADEFREYAEERGITHRKVTPLWAQANGEVERQNRSMLKSMRIAHAEGRNWRTALIVYLFAYRTTPHSVTGKPPAELLFGRSIRSKLPELREMVVNDEEMRDRDWKHKVQGQIYADQKRGAKESDIEKGDSVLLRQKKENKLSTNFGSMPYKVLEKKGNSVVVESPENVVYKRNVTEVKKFNDAERVEKKGDDEEKLGDEKGETDMNEYQRPVREKRQPDRYGVWA